VNRVEHLLVAGHDVEQDQVGSERLRGCDSAGGIRDICDYLQSLGA